MVGIKSIGIYEPENKVSVEKIFEDVGSNKKVSSIGVKEIPIELTLTATEMAIMASRNALETGKIDPLDIEVIINTQASLHDYLIWQVSAEVQSQIGANNSYFFDLYQGCTGFLMALIVAKQFLENAANNKILICSSEKWEPSIPKDRTVGKLIFSDGGVAAILEKECTENMILGYSIVGVGKLNDVSRMQIGAIYRPNESSNDISYFAYDMVNSLKGIKEMLPINIDNFYKVGKQAITNSKLTMDQVQHLVFPSVGFGVFEKVVKRFNIPLENTNYRYIANYGDGSTIDSLSSYHRMKEDEIIKEGDHVLIIGQGAGATWAAIVIKV